MAVGSSGGVGTFSPVNSGVLSRLAQHSCRGLICRRACEGCFYAASYDCFYYYLIAAMFA